jgi:hypothetical protein
MKTLRRDQLAVAVPQMNLHMDHSPKTDNSKVAHKSYLAIQLVAGAQRHIPRCSAANQAMLLLSAESLLHYSVAVVATNQTMLPLSAESLLMAASRMALNWMMLPLLAERHYPCSQDSHHNSDKMVDRD